MYRKVLKIGQSVNVRWTGRGKIVGFRRNMFDDSVRYAKVELEDDGYVLNLREHEFEVM